MPATGQKQLFNRSSLNGGKPNGVFILYIRNFFIQQHIKNKDLGTFNQVNSYSHPP